MSDKVSKILKASVLLLVISWGVRILSVLTMVVLARNLNKYDFGVLSGCYVIQGFFNAMVNTGGGNYLLRKEVITENDINAAWTINFSSKLFITIVIFVFSDYAADFMKIPELSLVMKVMSFSAFFQGGYNMAVNTQIKQLDYSKVSLLNMYSRLASSATSIIIAVWFHSYWAVIVSDVLYYFLRTLGSYFISHHRVRFVRENVFIQWQFSKWIMLKGIVNYIKTSCDKVLISRNYSVEQLGLYNFSMEASQSVSKFIIQPIKDVLYPGLSEYSNKYDLLVDKLNKTLLVLSCIYLPIVFGGVYLSDMIVPLVFGEKWTVAIPLFNVFLPMTFAGIMVSVLTDIFTLTGKVKQQFYYELLTSALFVIVVYVSIYTNDMYHFVLVRAFLPYVMLFLIVFTLSRIIPIRIFRLVLLFVPVAFSSAVMITGLYLFNVPLSNPYLLLISEIVLGAVIYAVIFYGVVSMMKRYSGEYDFLYKTFIVPLISRVIGR